MKPFIFCWNRHSASGKMLAKALKADFGHPESMKAPKVDQPVINWGSSFTPPWHWQTKTYLNKPEAVGRAVNKLKTFRALQKAGVPTLEFTTSAREALDWINGGVVVYARERLTGKQGEGLHVYDLKNRPEKVTIDSLEKYKVFTKRFHSFYEFKLHVMNGKVDHVIRVSRDTDYENDPYVRNHNNGWTFYDEDRKLAPEIYDAATAAIRALGLDFGVVDMGVAKEQRKCCVYEVNTAPGGMHADILLYVKALKREFGIKKGV